MNMNTIDKAIFFDLGEKQGTVTMGLCKCSLDAFSKRGATVIQADGTQKIY